MRSLRKFRVDLYVRERLEIQGTGCVAAKLYATEILH